METITIEQFTKKFFRRAFPNQKYHGVYFDEWLKRFLGNHPEKHMTEGTKRIYWRLIVELGDKSPLKKPLTIEYDTNLNQCFKKNEKDYM